jgi:hypothetical protein
MRVHEARAQAELARHPQRSCVAPTPRRTRFHSHRAVRPATECRGFLLILVR